MAIARIKERDSNSTYYNEFAIDKESDIADLPKQPECATGSAAICIENSEVYMLDSKGHWRML